MRHFATGLLVFLIWSLLGIGAYSYYKNLQAAPVPVVEEKPNFEALLKGQSDALFTLDELTSIRAKRDAANIRLVNDSLAQKIFDHLNAHQFQELHIIGLSHDTIEHDSLGLARARSFKAMLTDFGVNGDDEFNYRRLP